MAQRLRRRGHHPTTLPAPMSAFFYALDIFEEENQLRSKIPGYSN